MTLAWLLVQGKLLTALFPTSNQGLKAQYASACIAVLSQHFNSI